MHILTEGSQTEVIYFKALARHLGCKNITVQPGKSADPLRLLNEAIQLQQTADPEVWVVLDAEVPGKDRTRDRRLKKALEGAKRYGVPMALSEPCFEAWLLAHFDRDKNYAFKQSSQFYADLLSKKLGTPYRKNEYDVTPFLTNTHVQNAIHAPAGQKGLGHLLKRLGNGAGTSNIERPTSNIESRQGEC